MNDFLIGAPRRAVLHEAATPDSDAAENTAENNALRQDAADAVQVQDAASSGIEDFTISVQQVRDHFKSKGLIKSKDTIQRWCRAGDLDCKKLGVLGRYFTTEASLLKLEERLLPDMIADGVGVHAGAPSGIPVTAKNPETKTQVHDAADMKQDADIPVHAADDTAAFTGTQQHVQVDAPASSGAKGDDAATVAELRAQVVGLTSQLEQVQDMNQFLREEIVSSRGQRGDVVKIAEQMLGTLETIAVGGRLEKPATPRQQGSEEAVRYQQVNDDMGAV